MLSHPRHTAPAALLSACALLATACQSPLDDRAYEPWIERDPAAWRVEETSPLTHHAETLRPTPDAAPDADAEPLPDDVEALVALALRRNPGLLAAQRRVERLAERRPQVTSLDDPMFTIAPVGQMAQTAAGEVGLMSSLSQRLPTPGKLEARGRMADADVAAARQRLAERRLSVAAAVRRAYWSRVEASRAAAVLAGDRDLIARFRDAADARYRAGDAEQQDVLRAGVELIGVDNRLLALQQQRRSAGARLNQLLGRATDAPLPEPAPADPPSVDRSVDLALDPLLAAAAEHPSLRMLRQQAARYRQQRRLANLDRYPDLTVSLTYNAVDDDGLSMSANGEDQWWLGFGVNLPIWQARRDAAQREALIGLLETSAEMAEQQNQLAFRIHDALARVRARRRSLALIEEQMLPEARQAVEAAENSYRAGRVDFLTLIDNTRRLTELQLMRERALTQLQQDLADLREAAPVDPEQP